MKMTKEMIRIRNKRLTKDTMSNKRTRKDDEQHNSRKLSTHNLLEINKKISKISQKLQILGQIFPENFMLQKQNGAPLNFF
jgi:hypothetical protein